MQAPAEGLSVYKSLLEQVQQQLQFCVHEVLNEFNGQSLAAFRWRHRERAGVDGVATVRLAFDQRRILTNPWFQLQWTTGQETTFSQFFQLSFMVLKTDKLRVLLNLAVDEKHEEAIRVAWDLNLLPALQNATAGAVPLGPLELPWPNQSPGLEKLAATWFAPSEAQAETSAIERIGLPAQPDLKPYWPSFLDGTWSIAAASLRRGDGPGAPVLVDKKQWGRLLLAFCLWASLAKTFGEDEKVRRYAKFCEPLLKTEHRGLPARELYTRSAPQRKALLLPHEVLEQLSNSSDPLHVPWHVIEAACAAINAGRHVIFTGPPGCGKSKLARRLAKMAAERQGDGTDALMATASEAWTSGDLIGRYLPRKDGKGLKFVPGLFLRAVRERRWLILDEFNRCNIDQCFGELFSVLAGDPVELPFEDGATDEDSSPVRLIPARHAQTSELKDRASSYIVPSSFRLIGTMNDVDRATLHQLSFALLRRFGIIRIDPPAQDQMRTLLSTEIESIQSDAGLPGSSYRFSSKKAGKGTRSVDLTWLRSELEHLFARTSSAKEAFGDLIAERVVGVASVLDVLRFVAEGLQAPENDVKPVEVEGDRDEAIKAVALSYLAMGLVLCVFPQLDALDPERFILAVTHLLSPFRKGNKPIVLQRLVASEKQEEEQSELTFRVEVVKADSTSFDADGDGLVSIPEFLVGELLRQYRGSGREDDLRALLKGSNA
ncbi:MAG: AAA family ATPase [Polyangiaceae bacterium]|nr:AAA family ATPase [Polyangiaceae bacterium]